MIRAIIKSKNEPIQDKKLVGFLFDAYQEGKDRIWREGVLYNIVGSKIFKDGNLTLYIEIGVKDEI